MLSFAYPKLLILLCLIPALLALFLYARSRKSKDLKKFGKMKSLLQIMPDISPYKPIIRIVLVCAIVAMLVITLSRPWGGIKDQKTNKEGIEVVIAMDASNSMLASATDNADGASRLRTAKLVLERLIGRLDNDKVGLLMYAASSYTLIPVTNDYVSAKMFLNSIDPSQVKDQGTNIAAAVEMASASFSANKNIGKAIILITDAEELENKEAVMNAVASASKNGIQVDVVGVGSPKSVPLIINGSQMINEENGEPVMTRLNEELATEIAKVGHGIYVNASNRDALSELTKQLQTLKKAAFESSFTAVHDELFGVFAWIALVLLLAEILLSESKNATLDKFTFFKKEK